MQFETDRILKSQEKMVPRVCEMAARIAPAHPEQEVNPVITAVLTAAIIFLADLIRHLPIKMKIRSANLASCAGKTRRLDCSETNPS